MAHPESRREAGRGGFSPGPGKPHSAKEIHFLSEHDLRSGVFVSTSLAADWKTPRDCIKTGRAIKPYYQDFFNSIPEKLGSDQLIEETESITEQIMNSLDFQFRCVKSSIILDDHPGLLIRDRDLPAAHYYLLRYVANSFSLTEMESMDVCKLALALYTETVGREAECGKSYQSILYK